MTVAGGTLIEQAVTQVNRVASGNRGQTAAPSDTFKTRDGWVLVSAIGQPLYERWAILMGEAHWLTDPRFADDAGRGQHGELISERMQSWTATRTTAEVLEALDAARIPCGEVLSPQEALDHPQVEAMHYLEEIEYPGVEGSYPLPRIPIEFSKIQRPKSRRPPLLSEHTDEILRELGFSVYEIARFRELRIV
jgi:crotonobetainyl-CoA:carnitine CoA-transferase CaiB-like acyl-CoA transferase